MRHFAAYRLIFFLLNKSPSIHKHSGPPLLTRAKTGRVDMDRCKIASALELLSAFLLDACAHDDRSITRSISSMVDTL